MKHIKKEYVSVIIILIILYGGMQLAGITCPIKFFTGISCAGCGMTRAWLSILRMNVREAFSYHPLFWVVPVAGGVYLFRKKISARLYKGLLYIGISIFLIVYIYRLCIDRDDLIVVFEPSQGMIAQIFRELMSRINS